MRCKLITDVPVPIEDVLFHLTEWKKISHQRNYLIGSTTFTIDWLTRASITYHGTTITVLSVELHIAGTNGVDYRLVINTKRRGVASLRLLQASEKSTRLSGHTTTLCQ
jgi:hypothetical protein